MLPRVLILYTGGTFGMDLDTSMAVANLSPAFLKKRLCSQVPELQKIARCDVDVLLNRDSAHIGPDHWLMFAKKIQTKWKDYDGVVMIHGTDTLAYTASALSFLLRPCLKPVVITGAQRPLSAMRTDARTNLVSAVEVAAHGPRWHVNQVSVFFGNTLFQGNRVRKKSASDFSAFESPNSAPLAVVGTTIRYAEKEVVPTAKKAGRTKHSFKFIPDFDTRILMIRVTPGLASQALSESLLKHLDGIVLVAFHSGTAPTHEPSFLRFLETAQKMGIPVIVTTEGSTQPPTTHVQSILYAAGEDLRTHGCFWAGTMTPECAYVKASFLLAQWARVGKPKDLDTFSSLWQLDLAGEGL